MIDTQKKIMKKLRGMMPKSPFSKGKDNMMNMRDVSNLSSPQTPINTVFYNSSASFVHKPCNPK